MAARRRSAPSGTPRRTASARRRRSPSMTVRPGSHCSISCSGRTNPEEYATWEILTLDLLPCWKGLTEEQRQRRAVALVADIEGETVACRKKNGIRHLGLAAILTQDPHRQPA